MLNMLIMLLLFADGYTVSDVVMYWRNNQIRGVQNAELPQFTILGYQTNDRVVSEAAGAKKNTSAEVERRKKNY